MESVLLFVLRILLVILIAQLGKKRKIGFGWSLALCVVSPLIGLIVILCSKKNDVEFVDIEKDK